MSDTTDERDAHEDQPESHARRALLTKYGPYTAPVVVAMLSPRQAYAHSGSVVSTIYPDTAACIADNNMTMHNMMSQPMHCNNQHNTLP